MQTWGDDDSALFLRFGRAFTPHWEELRAAFAALIPSAPAGAPTVCVDAGSGSGWLSETMLRALPHALLIAVDGSQAMLEATRRRVGTASAQLETRRCDLQDLSWLDALPDGLHCIASSLALHHLNDEQKQLLYQAAFTKLQRGGALLIADLVQPLSELERELFASSWEGAVQLQSVAEFGDARAWEAFQQQRWNHYRFPDPIDIPATLPDMLAWLAQAGFIGVDVFWAHAGHALVGGFKP
ncbi:MAG: methyltransferase domain-containing protein [Candidatus Eremiobacteraeota bacterium]|nr:methyltransferase domain-containing protein [Candidatus Eremiobacteraeota bacterium]